MSDLTSTERRKLEQLLGMSSGYVLGLSKRTFDNTFFESMRRSIYDPQYDYGSSSSKANRLRGFWRVEGNSLVGKVMGDMLAYALDSELLKPDDPRLEDCRRIVGRIKSEPTQAEYETAENYNRRAGTYVMSVSRMGDRFRNAMCRRSAPSPRSLQQRCRMV